MKFIIFIVLASRQCRHRLCVPISPSIRTWPEVHGKSGMRHEQMGPFSNCQVSFRRAKVANIPAIDPGNHHRATRSPMPMTPHLRQCQRPAPAAPSALWYLAQSLAQKLLMR